ncbi:MAG TPA: tRNA lysidine(34) synthetase TilS [Anaerolineaceae bacterium]
MGISGGPDSLCMLGVLQELGCRLVVAHFDHQLRPESGADAAVVRRTADTYGLPFALGTADVRAMAHAQHLSIEEAARKARYQFLFQTARESASQAVSVAHTADDQVETVLMHLLRGSGLAGLKGMRPCSLAAEFDADIPLVRPLLYTWREETLSYCQEHALEPLFDPSNADTTFFRNRLRHELIPSLQTYNPQVKDLLLRTAETLAGDYSELQSAARYVFEGSLRERAAGYLVFEAGAWQELPIGMARSVIRLAIGELRPGLRDVDFAAVERAVEFVQSPPATRHVDLVAGLDLECAAGMIILREHAAQLSDVEWPQLLPGDNLELAVPGRVRLAHGWWLSAETETVKPAGMPAWGEETGARQTWMDAALVGDLLHIRARRPGDRFTPLGLDGHTVKLSDYFINVKLPRRARDGWPLVYAGDELAWVPGYRSSELFRVGEETRVLVKIRLSKD